MMIIINYINYSYMMMSGDFVVIPVVGTGPYSIQSLLIFANNWSSCIGMFNFQHE